MPPIRQSYQPSGSTIEISRALPGRHRPRRLRRTAALRRLTAEASLVPSALVQPIFVRDGIDRPRELPSMPGVFQHSVDSAVRAAAEAASAGVGGIMMFGIPSTKDETGAEASDPDGILQRALRAVVGEVGQHTVVIADLNLDEYTTHGHSGVLGADGDVDNDASIVRFAEVAVAQADAGAQMVAPSGMMDGQVGAIRAALDAAGHQSVGILAYAAKFASSLYRPFRDAVESSLTGNRRTYQQYPGNRRESLREVLLDVDEAADIVMVKPALPYLDVIADVAAAVTIPVAATATRSASDPARSGLTEPGQYLRNLSVSVACDHGIDASPRTAETDVSLVWPLPPVSRNRAARCPAQPDSSWMTTLRSRERSSGSSKSGIR